MIENLGIPRFRLWVLALLLFAVAAGRSRAADPEALSEFRDDGYGYRFLYPASWKLETLPEGEANPGLRLRLLGPSGSSFVAIVERTGQPLSKVEFEADRDADKRVDAMMRKTVEQTYRSISRSLGARDMKVGERRNLTDDRAIRYYIATLHRMKTGNPVIVAGTHVYPFFKDYSVSFLMTAFHRGNAAENQILIGVFNSFRLIDTPPPK